MGNGYPLAAAVCRPELGNCFRDKVMYFNTYGGNPVACAVGLAVLEVIEREDLVANSRDVGAYLRKGLKALAGKYDLIGDVRGCGLFTGVEMVSDRETKKPAPDEAYRIVNRMKERGVLISRIGLHSNILKMRPPLCFNWENADFLLNNLDHVLARL
jgi:4-aminobutyrate aminotransferase-like enzyme